MKEKIILILIALFFIPYSAYAVDDIAKKKYPYAMLTADYGVLNEKDLDDGLKPEPFSPKELTGHVYWQCYPRRFETIAVNFIGDLRPGQIEAAEAMLKADIGSTGTAMRKPTVMKSNPVLNL